MATGTEELRLAVDRVRTLVAAVDIAWADALGPNELTGEADYRQPLHLQPTQVSHRRFQVRIAGSRPPNGMSSFSGSLQDVVLTVRVGVGYHVGGGDAVEGDLRQMEELAIQDAEGIRQQVCRPSNRTNRMQIVNEAGGVTLVDRPDGAGFVAEQRFDIYLRVAVE